MPTFLFPYTPPLREGDYLMGSPQWTRAMSLVNARVVCLAGASRARTILEMEVDGELTGRQIPVLPLAAEGEINFPFPLNYIVPANAELRFKCVQAPEEEDDCVRELGLNLTATLASADSQAGGDAIPTGDLHVDWVNGTEAFRLFDYSAATKEFSESVVGLSSGRASIVNGPNCTVTIDGTVALAIGSDQVLQTGRIVAIGGTAAAANPRLEFWRGSIRLASLTKAGQLSIVDLTESLTLLGGSDRFELLGNGSLAAVIGPVRLTGLSFQELG